MALSATTVTAGIAALSISGVTVKDVSGIPSDAKNRDCPILFPMPGDWLGSGAGAPDTESTFGAAGSRYWHVHRTYTYVLLTSQVGTGRGVDDAYNDGIGYMDSVFTAITSLNVSGVDVENVTHTPFGVVTGPNEKKYHGAVFTISIRERINA